MNRQICLLTCPQLRRGSLTVPIITRFVATSSLIRCSPEPRMESLVSLLTGLIEGKGLHDR